MFIKGGEGGRVCVCGGGFPNHSIFSSIVMWHCAADIQCSLCTFFISDGKIYNSYFHCGEGINDPTYCSLLWCDAALLISYSLCTCTRHFFSEILRWHGISASGQTFCMVKKVLLYKTIFAMHTEGGAKIRRKELRRQVWRLWDISSECWESPITFTDCREGMLR